MIIWRVIGWVWNYLLEIEAVAWLDGWGGGALAGIYKVYVRVNISK